MAQIPAHVKQQLKLLRKVSGTVAENAPAGIVDVRIKDLKPHDLQRAVYVLSNSFAELTHKQQVIFKVIKSTQEEVKKMLNDNSISRSELEAKLRELILEEIKTIPDVPHVDE